MAAVSLGMSPLLCSPLHESRLHCRVNYNSLFPSSPSKTSASKRGFVHNHSYENEFNLPVNEISFSYERMSIKTRFEEEV